MPLNSSGKNTALDAWAAAADFASLHNDIPSDVGSNEISGGSPAYARKAVGWDPASAGVVNKNGVNPTFDVPAGTSVFYVGFWTLVSGGTFLGYSPLNGGGTRGVGTMANSGDVVTSYAHGLANTNRVTVRSAEGGVLPTGLNETTIYFVVGATADTFQLSLTSGGAAVVVSSDSELIFQRVIPETFGSQGTLTVTAASVGIDS